MNHIHPAIAGVTRVAGAGRVLAWLLLAPLCASAAAVSGLEAVAVPLQAVFLRWTDSTTNETGFLVERRPGGGDFTAIATVPANGTAFTDTGLDPDTPYTYRVQALVAGDTSASVLAVTTLPEWTVPVARPALSQSAPDTLQLAFAGAGATYTVQASTDLADWSGFTTPLYLDATSSMALEVPVTAAGKFYRVVSSARERPPRIGLSVPFETAPEPAGTIWDVTAFGASPSNLSATNDDAIGIKAAISVAQPGDTVYIPAGVYTIRQELRMPNGVTLRGAGMDQTVLITEGITRAVYVPPQIHNVRIEDFAINYLGSTEELQNGVYIGSVRTGQNSYRVVVDGLRIEGFSVHGVSLRDCHHVLVQNCVILNATNLGDGGHGYGVALNYPTNHDNWIRNNTIGPVIRHAILVQYYAHNNLIEHNLAQQNTEDCFDLHGEDEYANELRYNTARDSDRDGFGVGNTGGTPPHDRSGPGNWIHHNTVENCAVSGIEVIQGSDVVYIDENTFTGNSYGVRVHDIGGRHIYIRGNTIRQNRRGISLTSARWVWLQENRIEDQTLYGIEILTAVEDLVDEGNLFSGNNLDYKP